MRRLISVLVASILLAACSVDVSTDLVPTTSTSATTVDVPDNEALAILLLDWREVSDEFLAFFAEQEARSRQISTIGEYVEWGEEQHQTNDRILDEWDDLVASMETYMGSDLLDVTDAELRRFVSLATDFSAGYRYQADPETLCFDLIPPSAYNDPGTALTEIPGYSECLMDSMSDPVVQRSLQAGQELSTAYNALYIGIFGSSE